jgi:flagellar basal-body rod protein FlgB
MPLIANPTTSLLEHVLRFRNQRHDVIAANIANADTPGFRAFDLELSERLAGPDGGLALTRSNARHLGSGAAYGSAAGTPVATRDAARLDGNNVSLDSEFIKLTENRLMYQTAFELYDGFGAITRAAREVR